MRLPPFACLAPDTLKNKPTIKQDSGAEPVFGINLVVSPKHRLSSRTALLSLKDLNYPGSIRIKE